MCFIRKTKSNKKYSEHRVHNILTLKRRCNINEDALYKRLSSSLAPSYDIIFICSLEMYERLALNLYPLSGSVVYC